MPAFLTKAPKWLVLPRVWPVTALNRVPGDSLLSLWPQGSHRVHYPTVRTSKDANSNEPPFSWKPMVVFIRIGESGREPHEHHHRPVDSKTIITMIFADEEDSGRQKKLTWRVWVIRSKSTPHQHRSSMRGCSGNLLQVSVQVRETLRKTRGHRRIRDTSSAQ